MAFYEAVEKNVLHHPKITNKTITYGTAGFRFKADELDFIMYRMGLLAALRSKDKKAAIGIMITASHNPVEDNGIKLVDPRGEMLAMDWEKYATELASVSDTEITAVLQKIIDISCISLDQQAVVIIGRDTRPSGEVLQAAAVAGIRAMEGEVKDIGVISTPLLHYVVTCHNDNWRYGIPSLEGYLQKLSSSFKKIRGQPAFNGNYKPVILFDGANGVGSNMMMMFKELLKGYLDVEMYNTGNGTLNYKCGADFVKVQQQWPCGVPRQQFVPCVSVDGDADRVIYSYIDSNDTFHMLDGDKIAILIAEYLHQLVTDSKLVIRLGLVQTAYANGASTKYVTETLGIPVKCAKTGVKYLHHAALSFDIGIYFEANGHGTVIFSDSAREKITKAATDHADQNAQRLLLVMNVINETVGDAISDMLLVETILHDKGWSLANWDESYTNLPNRLTKVLIADRTVIRTADSERTCTAPAGLQEEIDKLVEDYPSGRAFVRPSGTEDIVRVYAEASAQEEADCLAHAVASAVYRWANGVGQPPTLSF